MSEMVERVARALAKKDEFPAEFWLEFIEPARAAIEAMREPTGPMKEVGGQKAYDIANCHPSAGDDECVDIYRAMIAAALKD